MCRDEESPLYLGAEKDNSLTAELQANVMARLWLLQSGLAEHTRVFFCMIARLLRMLSLASQYRGLVVACAGSV